jgi:hypothetical protein
LSVIGGLMFTNCIITWKNNELLFLLYRKLLLSFRSVFNMHG